MRFGINVSGTLGLPASRLLLVDETSGPGKVFGSEGKRIDINKDVMFELEQAQIINALNTYPYMPNLYLTINKNEKIEVPRDATIAATLSIGMVTDGTMELYNKNRYNEGDE